MGIILGSGSFRGQCGDHFRVGDHFKVRIISGAVQTLGSRFNAIWHEGINRTHFEGINLQVLTCSLMVILLSQGHVTVCKCIGQSIAGLQMTSWQPC